MKLICENVFVMILYKNFQILYPHLIMLFQIW